jgi:hypothetical protein
MNESDIEDLFRRYRPIGPPARLRERILAMERPERVWPWMAAAAALLVSALMLRFATGYEAADVYVTLGPAAETRVAEDLTDRLGGDADARGLAQVILVEQQVLAVATVRELQ